MYQLVHGDIKPMIRKGKQTYDTPILRASRPNSSSQFRDSFSDAYDSNLDVHALYGKRFYLASVTYFCIINR